MAEQLEQEVRQVLDLLDSGDFTELAARMTDDAQGVDEISRNWRRGREALEAYFDQLEGTVSNVHSEISDLNESIWGDVGVATFVLAQTYEMSGQEQKLSAPTTMLFRREGGAWKIALVHSVPIPDEP